MNSRRFAAVTGTALALVVVMAVAGAAVGPFSPAAQVIDANCQAERVSGDAARSPGGATRGFVSFEGGQCGPRVIHWFTGRDDTWRTGTTPYRGAVLASAVDGRNAVVLFANANGTFLGRRRESGTFDAARRLSRSGLTGAVIPSGDVIASGGRFWAVWNEQVGPGGEFAQTELFQSQNIGQGHYFDGVMGRTRITRSRADDDSPTLVAEPLHSGEATYALVWTRSDGARGENSDLRLGRANASGEWAKTTFATRGYNSAPDLFAADRSLWLAFTRNNRPVVTRRVDGAWGTGKVFSENRGMGPVVTASRGNGFVAWTSLRPRNVVVAQGPSGWTVRNITDTRDGEQSALAATSYRGRVTVLFVDGRNSKVMAKTQQP